MTLDAAALLAQLGVNPSGIQTDPVLRALISALAGVPVAGDFNEAVDDRVAALLAAGANITLTYNDAGNLLSVASTGGGGGSGAEVQLEQQVKLAAAPEFNFAGPWSATYRDLRLRIRARSDNGAANFSRLRVQFNGDATANYDYVRGNDHDSGVEKEDDSTRGNTWLDIGVIPGAAGPANYEGVVDVHIANFGGVTFYKAVKWEGGGTAVGELYHIAGFGVFKSTAAITAIKVLLDAGQFIVQASATLYGVQ